MEDSGLEVLEWLPLLESLQQLHLARNTLSTVRHAAALFPLLEVLDISGNYIEEWEELVSCVTHPCTCTWHLCPSPPSCTFPHPSPPVPSLLHLAAGAVQAA